jgi:hypothetical protein
MQLAEQHDVLCAKALNKLLLAEFLAGAQVDNLCMNRYRKHDERTCAGDEAARSVCYRIVHPASSRR